MAFGRLITVSGTDCSGKTTQIEMLEEALRSRGERVRRFWFRPGYSEEMDALRTLVRGFLPSALPRHTQSAERSAAFQRPGVSGSWVAMAVVDSLVQYSIRLRATLLKGTSVICDRYLWDAGLDLDLRFPGLSAVHRPLLRAVELSAPRPVASFLLLVPYDVLTARAEVKKEPFPDSEICRLKRWQRYSQMESLTELTTIDANRPITTVHQDILDVLALK